MDRNIGWQCFICGKSIENKGGVDPCGVDLIANVQEKKEHLDYQRFNCHIQCFKAINKHASVYKKTFETAIE
jgi:hypothetical protein